MNGLYCRRLQLNAVASFKSFLVKLITFSWSDCEIKVAASIVLLCTKGVIPIAKTIPAVNKLVVIFFFSFKTSLRIHCYFVNKHSISFNYTLSQHLFFNFIKNICYFIIKTLFPIKQGSLSNH